MKVVNKRNKIFNKTLGNSELVPKKLNTIVGIAGSVLVVSGFLLVGFNVGWLVAAGVYLMIWGNNVGDFESEE